MARLRSQGRAAGPVPIPEPRRRGRSRASTNTITPIRSDVFESSTRARGRPRKSKTSEEPPSSQRRQTRSHTDNQTFESLSTPRRKRRRTIGEPEDQPAKRQHSDDAEGVQEEEQPSQNGDRVEDDDDDESAPPGQDFFKNINKTILPDAEQIHKLPKLRPDDSAEYHSENEGRTGIVVELSQDDHEDAIEVEAETADAEAEAENDAVIEVEAEIEDSQADKDVEIVDEAPAQAEDQEEPSTSSKQPASMEQPESTEQDDPESRLDPSQPEPSQSGKRKKRRQSRKATFGEPNYQVPRAASPVLGSDPPRSQIRKPSKSKQPLLSQAQQNALYEIVGDDEENHQEQQGQASTAAAQAAKKRGRTQSQATRSPAGRRREVTENTAAEVEDGSYADDDSEADEEPLELELEAEHEQGGNVESEDELESENDVSSIEDSLLIEPPNENEPALSTKIHGKVVQKLVTIMTSSGWMGKRKWDRDAKLEAASARRDFKEALKNGSRPLARSRVILAHVYGLLKLCHKLPKLPRLDDQNKYFREHKAQFNRLITKTNRLIELYISTISEGMGPGHDDPTNRINNRRIISKLHRSIIPMLVWLLRDAFLAGCDISDDEMQQAVNHTGEFTPSTLQLLTRVSGWIRRLCEVLLNWSDLPHPKPVEKKKDWEKLKPAVETVWDEINQAIQRIDELQKAPERRRKALEHDRVMQREREKKQQQVKAVQDRQMQLFIESTQRKSSSQRSSHRATQEASSSRPASHRTTQTGSQSHPVAPRLSQEEEAEYFKKHGWHYWEDDRLLRTVRSSLHLDYQGLASLCPARSSAEVKERVKYLKDMVRRKYERIGTEPPLWTYEHLRT